MLVILIHEWFIYTKASSNCLKLVSSLQLRFIGFIIPQQSSWKKSMAFCTQPRLKLKTKWLHLRLNRLFGKSQCPYLNGLLLEPPFAEWKCSYLDELRRSLVVDAKIIIWNQARSVYLTFFYAHGGCIASPSLRQIFDDTWLTWYIWHNSSVPTHSRCSSPLNVIHITHGEQLIELSRLRK